MNSYKEMISLGSGELTIDVPSAACRFNGAAIPSLRIAGELQAFYGNELATHEIPAEGIRSATLFARLDLQKIDRKLRSAQSYFFAPGGKYIHSPRLYQCRIEYESSIITDDMDYRGKHAGIEEWPENL